MTEDELLAMEAGRELDALIAEHVMGRDPANARHGLRNPLNGEYELSYYWGYPEGHDFAPFYSTWIGAAWQVVERLYDGKWAVGIGSLAQEPRGWRVVLCNMWEDEFEQCPSDAEANGDTASHAICRAALLAAMEAECP